MYKLIMKRYGIDVVFNINTLKDTVGMALSQLEFGIAFPCSISKGNKEIWKFKNLSGINAELEGLVKDEN